MSEVKIPSGPNRTDIKVQKRDIERLSIKNLERLNGKYSDLCNIEPIHTFHNCGVLDTMSHQVAKECVEHVLKDEGMWKELYDMEIERIAYKEHEDAHDHVCYGYVLKDINNEIELAGFAYGPTERHGCDTEILELDVEVFVAFGEKHKERLTFKAFGF